MVAMLLIRKQEAKFAAEMLHLGNSSCFHPKSHLETHRQLQTSPTAKKSLPESPDEATACSLWGNGWPLTLPDSQPPCHPAVQQVKLGYNYSADNGLQLCIQAPESGRSKMIVAERGWEVKKSQDKPLVDTSLQWGTVVCSLNRRIKARWRATALFSDSEYHEDIPFFDFSRWVHLGLCDCLRVKGRATLVRRSSCADAVYCHRFILINQTINQSK